MFLHSVAPRLAACLPALLLALAPVACSSVDAPRDAALESSPDSSSGTAWRPVHVTALDVRLDDARPDLQKVGAALFRAGFALRSTDPDFGGFSGLLVEGDRMLAVSDHGHWWRTGLRHDAAGRLTGLMGSEMAPLADLDGRQVSGRMRRDAEELARVGGGLLVTFEGDHRSHVYPEAGHPAPTLGPLPQGMSEAPENGGMEAVTRLPGGGLLVVAEDVLDEAGNLRGWLSDAAMETWSELSVATEPGFKATAATTLPTGDVLLLQRFWTPEIGTRVRMLRLAAADLRPHAVVAGHELARLEAPLSVDNFEAVDVRTGPDGRLYAYLLADDNYSEDQRTLLFQLQLPAD